MSSGTSFDDARRRSTVETLDDPTEWPAVLRSLLRRADGPTDRETLEHDLRARYDDVCMLCGDRRQRGPEAEHAVVHYLMSPAPPYDVPLTPATALVVCLNHRGDPEHGTATVEHSYEQSVGDRRLLTADDHEVGAQYLAYHDEVIAGE